MTTNCFFVKNNFVASAALPSLWLLALFAAPLCGLAQSSIVTSRPANVRLVETVEGISEYRMSNGMQILLAPDASDQRVTVNVTYMVGSRHEGYGETGMAHLLEHLIFKGSPKTPDPKAEFAKRGFASNGTTTWDRTNYFANFQSDSAAIDWYLQWQADAMVNSFVARKDLDTEMTVVRNELERAENNPLAILGDRVRSSAYIWHNYGKTVIGAKSDIENVDIGSLQNFYRRYYRPDNALVLVAGNFDPTKTLASIAKAFGGLKAPAGAIARTYTLDAAQDGERSVVLRRPAIKQAFISAYHTPPNLHPDTEPLIVLALVLADGVSGRIPEKLKARAMNVFGVPALRREASMLIFGTELGITDDTASLEKAFLDIVEGVPTLPVKADELERAKAKTQGNIELIFANANSIATYAVEAAVAGDWRSLFVMRDRFAKVTLDDVNRVAQKYLIASNRTTGLLIPTQTPVRAPEPQLTDIATYMQDFGLSEKGSTADNFDYSIANIQLSTVNHNLKQGIKLSILNKPSRGDFVKLRMQLRFGALDTLTDRVAAGRMVNQLLVSGTAKYNRQQIQDELVKLGAALNINLNAEGGRVELTAKKDKFAQAFDLTAHLLKESDFPVSIFYANKNNWVKTAEGEFNDKSVLANNAFNRYGSPYSKGDPRYAFTSQDWLGEVKALTYEQVREFHANFYGAQNAQIMVIGPVDAAAVKSQAIELLENWQAPKPWQRLSYPHYQPTPARLVYDTQGNANATLRASVQLPLAALEVENWQLRLATRIFGGGPGSRLWTLLREQKGYSYDVSTSVRDNRYEKHTIWSLHSDIAPVNLVSAEKVINDALAKVQVEGFNAQELERAKAQWLLERRRIRSGDGYAFDLVMAVQEFDQEWDLAQKNDQLIASFTLEQINAVWRKHIAADKLVWGVFLDVAKSK